MSQNSEGVTAELTRLIALSWRGGNKEMNRLEDGWWLGRGHRWWGGAMSCDYCMKYLLCLKCGHLGVPRAQDRE